MNEKRPKILTFVEYYLPGYKSGGPIRTIANMVNVLGKEYEFNIVTRDRDAKDKTAYPDILLNEWARLGEARIFYLSPEKIKLATIQKIASEFDWDIVYLNSFFSVFTIYYLFLRRFKLVKRSQVIIAPRGEFAGSALQIRHIKKAFFINVARSLNLCRGIVWQASSEKELTDIKSNWSRLADVRVAANLPDLEKVSAQLVTSKHQTRNFDGKSDFIFLSRISPMKNLAFLLDVMRGINVEAELDIYGPIGDPSYWVECQQKIKHLPKNIKVTYRGSIEHKHIYSTLKKYKFLVLPTLGENFGHVIFESLTAGVPVIISDRTIWSSVKRERAGYVEALEKEEKWVQTVQASLTCSEEDWVLMSTNAQSFVQNWLDENSLVESNKNLFRSLVT